MNINEETIEQSGIPIKSIPLSKITQVENSRLTYNEEEMVSLMTSMRQTGLLQPIGVTETDTKGHYRVIFGNRRFLAAKKLGWKRIDASVFKTRDFISEMIANLSENMVRGDVPFAETGRIFHQLTQEGLTIGEIAARVSIPKTRVKVCLDAFNRVPVKFRDKIVPSHGSKKPGAISGASMTLILNQKLNSEENSKLFEAATKQELSKDQLTVIAKHIKKGLTVEEALRTVNSYRIVQLRLALKLSVVEQLLIEYDSPNINTALMKLLKTHPELRL